MTLISVSETRESSASVEVGATFSAKQMRYYDVQYSATLAYTIDAIYAAGLPVFGDPLGGGNLILKKKDSDRDKEDPTLYRIVCTYELPTPGQETTPTDLDPEGSRWAIDIQMHAVPYEVELQYDASGKMIVNSAGDPVSGVTTQKHDEEILVTFTTNLIDWAGIDDCLDKINDQPFTMTFNGQTRTYGQYTVRFMSYALGYVLDASGAQRPRMTYQLLYRKENWYRKVADKGLNRLVEVVGPLGNLVNHKIPIFDDGDATHPTPIVVPVYLDGAGQELPPNEKVVVLNNGLGVPIFEEVDLLTELLWDIAT